MTAYERGFIQPHMSWLKAGQPLLAHDSSGTEGCGLLMVEVLEGLCLYAPGCVSEQLPAGVPASAHENQPWGERVEEPT